MKKLLSGMLVLISLSSTAYAESKKTYQCTSSLKIEKARYQHWSESKEIVINNGWIYHHFEKHKIEVRVDMGKEKDGKTYANLQIIAERYLTQGIFGAKKFPSNFSMTSDRLLLDLDTETYGIVILECSRKKLPF